MKTLTSEIVIIDPVYIATDLSIPLDGSLEVTTDDADNTELLVVKDPSSRRDGSSLILDVVSVFADYFDRSNVTLGQTLDISAITNGILSITGVKTIHTRRKDNPAIQYAGLSMIAWNPVYPADSQLVTKNTAFSYFKYLFLNNKEFFKDKIVVTSPTKIYENIEY